jgi:hypothetical protein
LGKRFGLQLISVSLGWYRPKKGVRHGSTDTQKNDPTDLILVISDHRYLYGTSTADHELEGRCDQFECDRAFLDLPFRFFSSEEHFGAGYALEVDANLYPNP